MNKQELASEVAARLAMPVDQALAVIEVALSTITASLARGDVVRLVGFGQFSVSERQALSGRNPRTGDPMEVPARRVPKFRAGQHLRDALD